MEDEESIHIKLLTAISDAIEAGSPEKQQRFIEHMKRFVPEEELASKTYLIKKLKAMAAKGKLGVGNYEHLKKIAEDSDNAEILDMVKKAEHKIQAWQGRSEEQELNQDKQADKYNGEAINELCKLNGRNSKKVLALCEDVSSEIKDLSDEIQCVWPGYRLLEPKKIVFVVFTEPAVKILLPRRLQSLDVVFKDIKSSSSEDKHIMSSVQKKNKPLTAKERSLLNDVFESKTEELMDIHKRLSLITACSVKSKSYDTPDAQIINKTCIVLYVRVKGIIPIEEEPFPEEINNIPTDVREGAFNFYRTAKEHHTSLKIGCQISENATIYGTLGPFVLNRQTKMCSITSAHVLLSPSEHIQLTTTGHKQYMPDDKIAHQPLSSFTDSKFGHVSDAVFKRGGNGKAGVEVALIEITNTNRSPESHMFPEFSANNMETAGFGNVQPTFSGRSCDELQNDSVMYKFGCESGITTGVLEFPASVQLDFYPNVRLHNQISIRSESEPFSVPGDSGSLVAIAYNDNLSDLRAIGIVTGGMSNHLSLVTPLNDILDALGCRLV